MGSPLGYLALLGGTLLVEALVAAGLAGRGRRREVLLASLALNLVTHPLATGLVWLADAEWLSIELLVTAAEAVGYGALTSLGRGRAIGIAVAANLLSALVGVVLVLA